MPVGGGPTVKSRKRGFPTQIRKKHAFADEGAPVPKTDAQMLIPVWPDACQDPLSTPFDVNSILSRMHKYMRLLTRHRNSPKVHLINHVPAIQDRKSTRLNSSHVATSYA